MDNYKPDSSIILLLANRKQCFICKHREAEGFLLESKGDGINPSAKWLFHLEDTHGLPRDVVVNWMARAPYTNNEGSLLTVLPW